MNDKERLLQWMESHGLSASAVAEATGDFPSNISMMTKGPRDVNQAFKWRFGKAFGFAVAEQIFIDEPINHMAEPV